MVFENILDYHIAEKNSFLVFLYSFILTSVSLFVAYFIFPKSSSVVFLFLITLSSVQMIYNELKHDEEEDENSPHIDKAFLKRNEKIIKIYAFLFLGCMICVSFWCSMLPEKYTDTLFSKQNQTINNILRNDNFDVKTGNTMANNIGTFSNIVKNNFQVMSIAFIFSFIFGSGALFIIFWNASVIGVFLSQTALEIGYVGVPGIAHTLALSSIFLHGMPEAIAYFIAGIAGGILSIGMIKGKHESIIMKDAFVLFCVSILFVIIAGALEVWI